jgi:hypothetical protein
MNYKVGLWCADSATRTVGAISCSDTLKSQRYRKFLHRFLEKLLPKEHGFFYYDGANAITANNPMADMRNVIWEGGGGGDYNNNNTLNRRRP